MSRRRGAILLETVIALALFIGAASFTIGALRNTLNGLDRAEREAIALDLARSKLAELEAGLIELADLRDGEAAFDQIGSIDYQEANADGPFLADTWELEIHTERSEFTGLSLVTITVREFDDGDPETAEIGVTLRQLMAVVDEEAGEYEEDEMLEGLPEEPSR